MLKPAIIAWTLCLAACSGNTVKDSPSAPLVSDAVSSDGLSVRFEKTGQGETALVFVHCWCCDRQFWKEQVPVFGKDYTVVTMDLGGHGESGTSRTSWTIPAFAEDVKAVVDKLKLRRVVLIGHSMGGQVVVEAARQMPDQVIGLVYVDTLHNVEDKPTAEQMKGWIETFKKDFVGATVYFLRKTLFSQKSDPKVVEWVVKRANRCSPAVGIGALENVFAFDLPKAVAEVKLPMRAINTDLNPTNAEANRRHMQDYQFVIMKGYGHYPQLEDPETFNRHLKRYLDEICSN